MQLRNKVIIITGSTTGIGAATARRCLAEGARVMLHGRERERGEQLQRELGKNAAIHIDDLIDPEAPQRIVDATVRAFGRIDGVVNNAALTSRSDLQSTDAACFDRFMAVNARAPMLLIRAALPMLRQAEGSVVNIGSINAYTGEPKILAYSMSKGALMTLSRNLANVLAPMRVRVNHLNVGWVLTPNEYQLKLQDGQPKDWPEHPDPRFVPTGTMTKPEQIAAHIAFWLSDDSRPVSGSVVELEQYPVIGRNPSKEDSA